MRLVSFVSYLCSSCMTRISLLPSCERSGSVPVDGGMGNDSEASVPRRPDARAGDRVVRGAAAAAAGAVGHHHEPRGGAPHLRRGALAHPRPVRAQEAAGASLLRGAPAVPADPAAQSPGAHGLRDVAARAPDDPRVLLPVPGRHPGQPRAVAPHAPLRARLVSAVADREDPGAAAADPAHPPGHPGPRRART